MSNYNIRGSNIVFDHSDQSSSEVVLKSDKNMNFEVAGSDIMDINSGDVTFHKDIEAEAINVNGAVTSLNVTDPDAQFESITCNGTITSNGLLTVQATGIDLGASAGNIDKPSGGGISIKSASTDVMVFNPTVINAKQSLHQFDTTDATSSTDEDASIHTAGGVSVIKNVRCAGIVSDSTSTMQNFKFTEDSGSNPIVIHKDLTGDDDKFYIMKATSAGDTYLNCKQDKNLYISMNDTSMARFNKGGLWLYEREGLSGQEDNDLLTLSADRNYVFRTERDGSSNILYMDTSSKPIIMQGNSKNTHEFINSSAAGSIFYHNRGNSQATSITSGAITCNGGISSQKDINCQKFTAWGDSSQYRTELTTDDATGVSQHIFNNNGTPIVYMDAGTSRVKVLLDAETTSTTSGGFQCSGGVGIVKSLYVGVDIDYVGILTDVSDVRVKDEIVPLDSCLDKVNKMNPVSFVYNEKAGKEAQGKKKYGFVAQEMRKIDEELVKIRPSKPDDPDAEPFEIEDLHMVKESNIMPLVVGAIKDLDKRLRALEGRK